MVAFPTSAEIDEYAEAQGLQGLPRAAVAQQILDRDRRTKARADFIDADTFAESLKALQDAADEAQVRRDVFAAAVPVAARHIITHCLHSDKDFS